MTPFSQSITKPKQPISIALDGVVANLLIEGALRRCALSISSLYKTLKSSCNE